jgi:hypothetical protein
MRLSEVLHQPVLDVDGRRVGYVQDVRTEQNGPMVGDWGAALVVTGLLVTPQHWVSTLGYQAGHSHGPWLIRRFSQLMHRRAKFVPWEALGSLEGELRLNCRIEQLRSL